MKEEQLKKLLKDIKRENEMRNRMSLRGNLTEYGRECYRIEFLNTKDIIERLERVLYPN